MGAVAFNTYDFVKSLTDAGIEEEQAAAISAGILRAHEIADLATKADLRELQAQTKADLRELQAQNKAELQEVKADLQEVKAEMREMELRIDKKLTEMKGESILVRWMLGLIMAGIAALMIKSFFGT